MDNLIFEEIVQNQIEVEPIKKGRGRPKGSTKAKIQNENLNDNSLDFDKEIENLKATAKKAEIPKQNAAEIGENPISNNENPVMSNVVTGYMLLILCDAVIPSIICLIVNNSRKKNGKKPLNSSSLKLDKREKEDLEPIADEVANMILKGVDPLILFFAMLGGTYFSKISD